MYLIFMSGVWSQAGFSSQAMVRGEVVPNPCDLESRQFIDSKGPSVDARCDDIVSRGEQGSLVFRHRQCKRHQPE
jgi:type 1 fimbria pilin